MVVALLCSSSQTAQAETVLSSDSRGSAVCGTVEAELTQVGIEISTREGDETSRRARRRAFAGESVDALVVCRGRRVEVYYPDGSPLGVQAFTVSAKDDPGGTAIDVSERIRSERFVADVPIPSPYTPRNWWLGLGADVAFSPGSIAPIPFISVDLGYRFHRRWSIEAIASIQANVRTIRLEGLETRVRLDQYGGGLSYHPLALPRVDLALGARATAVRVGVRGTSNAEEPALVGQRDAAWVAFPAAKLTMRFALTRMLWLRVQGEFGAIVPRAVVSTDSEELGSVGGFAAQTGIALEVHFE